MPGTRSTPPSSSGAVAGTASGGAPTPARAGSLDFPQQDVFSVAASGVDGALYAGCEPSMLFVSRDRGESWTELASLREIPSAPTGAFRRDRGRLTSAGSPEPARGGAPARRDRARRRDAKRGRRRNLERPQARCPAGLPLARLAPDRPGPSVRSGRRRGLEHRCRSDMGGGRRRPRPALHLGARSRPTGSDCWFVSASTGPYEAHGAGSAEALVYRWRGPGPWAPLAGGLPQPLDEMPYALAFEGGRPRGAGRRHGLHERRQPVTWERAARGEKPGRILAFA